MSHPYTESLKANGATEEDLKVLDTPVARKVYDAQVKAVADEQARTKTLEASQRKWYDEQVVPTMSKLQKDADSARMKEAAAVAQLKVAQEAGLIEVAAAQDGVKPVAVAAAFDESKFVSTDVFHQAVQMEGDAIAIMADIAAEHSELFPGQRRPNWRELRKEAVAAKKPVEQVWREKYSVDTARTAKAAADTAAYEAKLRKEGDDAATARINAERVHPAMGIAQPSRTPFTGRNPAAATAADGAKIVHPWDRSEAEREQARQAPVVQRLVAQA